VIKVFTADGSDESLDEGMRAGCTGNAFDFVDIQDAEIRLPALIPEQRVIIRTEVVWDTLGRNGLVEHATQGYTVNITGVHAKANDASRELIHDDENPVALQ
jgi:hypothetical protein